MTEPVALPHSLEAERAVLATVLVDCEKLPALAERLVPEDFYAERHVLIYRAMLELQEQGAAIDMRTLQSRLEGKAQLDNIGGIAYLATMDLDLPDVGRVDAYVDIVKDRSKRREIHRLGSEIQRRALDGGDETTTLLARAEEGLADASRDSVRESSVTLAQAFTSLLEEVEERHESGGSRGVPTGFADLDEKLLGWRPRRFYIVAGRPGAGKTTFIVNSAVHAATHGARVGIISLEMGHDEIATSVLAAEARIDSMAIQSGVMSQREWTEAIRAVKRLSSATLLIDDTAANTLQAISAKIRRWKARNGLDVAIIDYLQLMETDGRRREGNRTLELTAITRGLKNLARRENIAVIGLSQLSRESAKRTDPRPDLTDLRESGSLEQDADVVAFVHRQEMFEPENGELRGVAELLIRKHRGGALGTVELTFIKEYNLFRSRVRGAVPNEI